MPLPSTPIPPNLSSSSIGRLAAYYFNIGLIFKRKGETDKALESFQKTLGIQDTIFDDDNLHRIPTYIQIASTFIIKGDMTRGAQFHLKALLIREKMKVPDNDESTSIPSVIDDYEKLGSWFRDMGKLDQALYFYKKIQSIQMKVKDPSTNLDLASTFDEIGSVYMEKEEYDEALAYYKKGLAIEEKVLEEDSSSLATAYSSIGAALVGKRDLDEALHYMQKARVIREKVFGADHEETVFWDEEMASIEESIRQRSESKEVEAIDLLSSLSCDDDESLLCEDTSDSSKGAQFHLEALIVHEKVKVAKAPEKDSDNNPDVADGFSKIGCLFKDKGNLDQALYFYKKALAIQEKTPDRETSIDLATTYDNMATMFMESSEFDQALSYYQKSLAIEEKVLDQDNPSLATSYSSVGAALVGKGELEEALEYMLKARVIREKVFGADHEETVFWDEEIECIEQSIVQRKENGDGESR